MCLFYQATNNRLKPVELVVALCDNIPCEYKERIFEINIADIIDVCSYAGVFNGIGVT